MNTSDMNFTLSDFFISTQHIDVRIGSLRYEGQLYDNYPTFQRDKVWPYSMKRSLIDSILRGFPIPELLADRRGSQFEIIDGQQRLSTILEYLADGFTTSRLKEDPCLQPIEPNKRYSRLSQQMRDRFDNYALRISVMDNTNEQELGALFRRLQHQQSLMLAEKLWTFTSEANRQCAELVKHEFWQTMYGGRQSRKRTFLACLYLLCMEISHGTTGLTTPCLRDVAAGTRDDEIKPAVLNNIRQRLENARHLFYGTNVQSTKEIIPLYQALILLEQSDCDFAKSTQGCLTPWFTRVRQDSIQARRTYGETDMLAKMIYSRYQLLFWSDELPKVIASEGICIIDQKRTFSQLDRIKALERQHGICPPCGEPITVDDIGHHIILHAKGGPTNAENCIILHETCHERMHTLPGTDWEILRDAG